METILHFFNVTEWTQLNQFFFYPTRFCSISLTKFQFLQKIFSQNLWVSKYHIHFKPYPFTASFCLHDSAVKLGCSDWCGLPLNALSKLLVLHLKGSRCNFWGLLHCDDWRSLAAMDLSMIAVALTSPLLVWISKVMPVWLPFSSFLFSFGTRNNIYYTSVSCVWFLLL